MRVLLLAAGLLLLSACAPTTPAGTPAADGWVDDGGWVSHRSMGNGVICYKYATYGISCVRP